MAPVPKPSLELRLRVLSAIGYAPGHSICERIIHVAGRSFLDPLNGHEYRLTWRTISTWLYRFRKHGITTVDNQTRSDKNQQRKITVHELAEAINIALPSLQHNKQGRIPKSTIDRQLIDKQLIHRHRLAPTTFYRFIREHQLLDEQANQKLRVAFAMQFANELWQADTLYGPSIQQPNEQWRKTPELLYQLAMLVNRDLKSRITFSRTIVPLNDQQLTDYIFNELEALRLGAKSFDQAAIELIIRRAEGNLRLCRNSDRPLICLINSTSALPLSIKTRSNT